MAAHKQFTEKTKMPVYFANPYSSWQRGTNENTNGLIRRKFDKKTDFRNVTPMQLQIMEDLLNNRPRKILKWKSPIEMIKNEVDCSKSKRINNHIFSSNMPHIKKMGA